jgi:UPF0271 protein
VLTIDLNADVGEGFGSWTRGDDAALLNYVTSVNVACGFHAGDPSIMDRTAREAIRRGVRVGAHPSYPDLRGFGRNDMTLGPEDIENDVLYQSGALRAIVESHGGRLWHVKPHGALYNRAARDESAARGVARGIRRLGGGVAFVGLATSEVMRRAAAQEGVPFLGEAFVDRAYEADGSLARRGTNGALIEDEALAAAQAVRIARDRSVATRDGAPLSLRAETLCLHGDGRRALEVARAVRDSLFTAGVDVRAAGAAGPA